MYLRGRVFFKRHHQSPLMSMMSRCRLKKKKAQHFALYTDMMQGRHNAGSVVALGGPVEKLGTYVKYNNGAIS